MKKISFSLIHFVSRNLQRGWKNTNTRFIGLGMLMVANYAFAQGANPFTRPICNVVNLFSGPVVTGIAFVAFAILLLAVMVTEARGVIGAFLKIIMCTAGLLALKSLITTLFGVGFGC